MDRYLRAGIDAGSAASFSRGDPSIRIDRASFAIAPTGPVIEVDLTLRSATRRLASLDFMLTSAAGVPVGLATSGTYDPDAMVALETGEHAQRWHIAVSHLANGPYQLTVQLIEPMVQLLARLESPTLIEVCRVASRPGQRVLEQAWQGGTVELACRRV